MSPFRLDQGLKKKKKNSFHFFYFFESLPGRDSRKRGKGVSVRPGKEEQVRRRCERETPLSSLPDPSRRWNGFGFLGDLFAIPQQVSSVISWFTQIHLPSRIQPMS